MITKLVGRRHGLAEARERRPTVAASARSSPAPGFFGEHDEVRRVVLEPIAEDLRKRIHPATMLDGVLILT
jgi:hypothetical protein